MSKKEPQELEIEPQTSPWANGPEKLRRNEFGLFDHVEYEFDETGFINWRELINPEHLYPNKDKFKNGSVPDSIEGLADDQLLIKLGGIKELARLRGYAEVTHDIKTLRDDFVTDICTIKWIPNYETDYKEVVFQDVANATMENCSGFGAKFLETIAANRAFVRAVRNFLGIHIVGADEIDKSKNSIPEDSEPTTTAVPSVHSALQKCAAKKGFDSWGNFLDFLREAHKAETYRCADTPNWSDFKDIPALECRKIMKLLKK